MTEQTSTRRGFLAALAALAALAVPGAALARGRGRARGGRRGGRTSFGGRLIRFEYGSFVCADCGLTSCAHSAEELREYLKRGEHIQHLAGVGRGHMVNAAGDRCSCGGT